MRNHCTRLLNQSTRTEKQKKKNKKRNATIQSMLKCLRKKLRKSNKVPLIDNND